MAKPTWDESIPAAANAAAQLPALAKEFFERGRAVMAGESDPTALHAFRLRAKRFRYTLEMFRPFYGPGLERCLGGLRRLQTFLGDLNDCATTRALAAEVLPNEGSTHRRRVERFLDGSAAELQAGLRKYWTTTFDAPGEETRWVRYLGRPKN